jgi:hypothetical protein
LALVAFSVAGFISFLIKRIRATRQDNGLKSPGLFEDAIIILPLVYLAFCWVNFQSGPDLIPLFPFVGLYAAFFLARVAGVRVGQPFLHHLPRASVVVLIALILIRMLTYRIEAEVTLPDQENRIASLSSVLTPSDKIFVHGTVEILVLLNRPNMNQHVDLRKGKDEFIAQRTAGGFAAFINELEASAPKIVAISRAGRLHHREELRKWITDHYDPLEVAGFEGIYVRRQR